MHCDRRQAGLATYLSEAWGSTGHGRVDLSTVDRRARRHNVVFDATADGVTHRLVATIVPEGETIINPIDAEAGVRALAEAGRCRRPPRARRANRRRAGRRAVHDLRLRRGRDRAPPCACGSSRPLASASGWRRSSARRSPSLHAVDPATVTVPLRTLEGEHPCAAALDAMRLAVDELPQRRPALELGLRWLDRHLPEPPARRSIVHSDVRNGNLIVGEDGLRAVLDWEGTLASGDPMQDARLAGAADVALPQRRRRDRRVRRAGSRSSRATRPPAARSPRTASGGGRSRARCAGRSAWPRRRWPSSTAVSPAS